MAAVVFLKLNGVRLRPDEKGYKALILGIAKGKAGKARRAEFFRRNTAKGRVAASRFRGTSMTEGMIRRAVSGRRRHSMNTFPNREVLIMKCALDSSA